MTIRVKISAVLFFSGYFLLGSSAVGWAALLAAFCHEMGHLIAMLLLEEIPSSMIITAFGAEITPRRPFVSYRTESICAAAGGLTNLVLAGLTFGLFPVFAGCNLALAGVNLAPCRGLDGGRVLECLLLMHTGEQTARRITAAVSFFTLAVLIAAADYFLLYCQSNLSLLLLCGFLFLSAFFPPGKKAEKRAKPKHTQGYRRFGQKSPG